ncbi:MAG: hypothetical protein V4671_04915 [Armatimonadota bacterium]
MAVLTANADRLEKDGKVQAYPVGAAKRIYQGALTVTDNTTGLLEAGADASGKTFAGIAYEKADNTSGAAAAITCRVQKRGSFLFALTGTAVTTAVIGKPVCISDDNTVALAATTTNDIVCGDIVAIESGKVRVRIDRVAA